MIYLDNSATSYPKPQGVRQAVQRAMVEEGANPGRSSYGMCFRTTQALYGVRQQAADFWGGGPECVAFQPSCTQALNVVLKGCLKPGDHVVASDLEHNAVMRPLEALKAGGHLYPGPDCPGTTTPPWTPSARPWPQDQAGGVHHGLQCVWRPPAGGAHCRFGPPVRGQGLRGRRPGGGAGSHQPGGERHRLPVLRRAQGAVRPHGTGLLVLRRPEEALATLVEGGTGTQSRSLEMPADPPSATSLAP